MNFIFNNPIKVLLGSLFVVILFHICVMSGIVPYDIVWGGRLTNENEMYVFETISILINVFLSWILLMKVDFVKFKFSDKVVKTILWTFFGLFILNTIGNVFAETTFEMLFALLTGIFAVLIWNIVKQKKTTNP